MKENILNSLNQIKSENLDEIKLNSPEQIFQKIWDQQFDTSLLSVRKNEIGEFVQGNNVIVKYIFNEQGFYFESVQNGQVVATYYSNEKGVDSNRFID